MSASRVVRRGDVVVVDLSHARGREMKKARPCVVVSPDDINAAEATYIVAPLTSGSHPYRYRIPCRLKGRPGHVVLDQVRVTDAINVSQPIGRLAPSTVQHVLAALREMFAE